MANDYMVEINDVTVRFNLASEKIDNVKEYFIKLVKRQLMFQEFLALQGVSLKIKKGEAWALVGNNGCGKSTLLKTVSGIIKPYKGNIVTHGSIAPMIELGAGFDMNLTARENIFLNGLVLGHTRKFMEEKFDDIVEFADLGQFLDSPIKNFSSGMKSRLGFSVATVVNPDILICDEILAVGDPAFQRKCKNRMTEMLSGGTTLLFVSHNIKNVIELCDHAAWIDHGQLKMAGDVYDVCRKYMEFIEMPEHDIEAVLAIEGRAAKARRAAEGKA